MKKEINYAKGVKKILSKWSKKALAKRAKVPEVSSH